MWWCGVDVRAWSVILTGRDCPRGENGPSASNPHLGRRVVRWLVMDLTFLVGMAIGMVLALLSCLSDCYRQSAWSLRVPLRQADRRGGWRG